MISEEKTLKRAIMIVLDGVGIGELPDAARYGDTGSHTLGNLANKTGGLNIPNLQKMGLGNIVAIKGVPPTENAIANFGKMAEQSPGKDSTSGHWEIAGYILDFDFPTYPNGFPDEVLNKFRELTGRDVLGNKAASGTEIIKELGEEHMRSGSPIIYTSADSVFQIAAHEEIIPLEEQYQICKISRKMLMGKHAVARVIARPFIGDAADNFTRTRGRRDFSLIPQKPLLQKLVQAAGIATIGIGKIDDLYAGVGLDEKIHTKSNAQGTDELIRQIKSNKSGLIMLNLVDFDMLWGHRNNTAGFKTELETFDKRLPEILELLNEQDILFLTADHGNDPTTPSTDHSREYVPLLAYGKGIRQGINLGIRETFADLGKTIAESLGIEKNTLSGYSFWKNIC